MVDGGERGVDSRDEGKHTGRNDLLFVENFESNLVLRLGIITFTLLFETFLNLCFQVSTLAISTNRYYQKLFGHFCCCRML